MNFKCTFCILIGIFIHTQTFGQTIKGNIKDNNGLAVIGAQVLNLRNNMHTHSDEKGDFQLDEIKIGDTIHIYHIGYEPWTSSVLSLSESLTIRLTTKYFSLEEVIISPKVNALNYITDVNVQTTPVNSSQEILRKVPGLFIGQHAGGGKAEQIFLRGFDIDHGTDISIAVDGLPVNMVSHAHGQGYADLHFLIPETIENIDFGKGPYYARKGNFNTAGYVNFKTKKALDYNSVRTEFGQFNTHRVLGMIDLINSESSNTYSYIATEYISTDGPFESPQNFNRINVFGKYGTALSQSDDITLTLSHFTSEWDASGQVPQRAVDQGLITRFGAIDDTEGGQTSRTNVMLEHKRIINNSSFVNNRLFYSRYNFELYSNFTFFLEDPVNGDQIRQHETRNLFGINSDFNKAFSTKHLDGSWQVGLQLRTDRINDNELSHTLNRTETLVYYSLGDINETNLGGYFNSNIEISKWSFNLGLRMDYFDFQYNDALQSGYQTNSVTKSIWSPNVNVLFNYSNSLQFYLKTGKGFHSNDTRVVIPQNGEKILPAAYGADLGLVWKPTPRTLINSSIWYLFSEQEFVYVGDAGIVEPSGQSRRQGIDFSLRYQAMDWLFLDLDANYTHARAIEEDELNDYIPLAPKFTCAGGITAKHNSGIYGSLNVRMMGDRPANEDNSIVAEGYAVADLHLAYQHNQLNYGVQIQNLFNTEWNETQFATESRLANENLPVEEIHFTPGTPFFLKGFVEYKF